MIAHVSTSASAAAAADDPLLARRDDLRVFHLSGAAPAGTPGLAGALFPLALDALAKPERAFADWPLVIDAEGRVERCAAYLQRALSGATVLDSHQPRLVRALGRALQGRDEPLPLAIALAQALESLRGEFDLSAKGFESLDKDLTALRDAVPRDALALGLGPNAALWLYALAAERRRAQAGNALRNEIADLLSHLRQLLRSDDRLAPTAQSAQAMSAVMGSAGNLHVDATALAGKLPPHAGTQRLQPERRQRIADAVATLDGWLQAPRGPGVLVAARALPPALAQRGWRSEVGAEPAVVARAAFDRLAAEAVPVVRAWQVARLERAGHWEERHAPLLERLTWRAFDGADWRFVPPVLAVLSGLDEAIAAGPVLTDLERTARPVRVLACYTISADPSRGQQAVGRALGLLALARPSGMQAATAVGAPDHLSATLQQLAAVESPAIVAVGEPLWTAQWPWLEAAVAHHCQAALCLRWTGLPGAGWADAFDVEGNADARGSNGQAHEPWSIAHAALIEVGLRDQFWFVPGQEQVAGLVQLDAWRDAPSEARSRLLPCVWARDAGGTVGRAVLTRELALAAESQARWWRCLRELAGLDNPFASRAAAEATAQFQAAAAAEKAALLAERDLAVKNARDEATATALDDLARALLNLDLSVVVGSAQAPRVAAAPVQSAPPMTVVSPNAAVAQSGPDPTAEATEEAFIDTVLCTSCNDCTNLNPLMFTYDANKQAHLADLSKGTYLQLVTAAEKCPARCIHPGAPQSGDATATADVVARAAKFN